MVRVGSGWRRERPGERKEESMVSTVTAPPARSATALVGALALVGFLALLGPVATASASELHAAVPDAARTRVGGAEHHPIHDRTASEPHARALRRPPRHGGAELGHLRPGGPAAEERAITASGGRD